MFDTSGAGKGLCVSATLLQILHPQEHAVWLCMWPLCALREQIHSWNVKFILLMLQLWVKLVPVLRDAHPICDIKFASVKTQVFWSACQVLLTFTNLETPQIHFLTRWAYPWNIPQWSQILKKTGILSETSEDGGLGLCSFEMSSFFWWYFSLWLTTHHHWISVALSISKFGQISPSPPISWNDPHSGFWKPMALQKKKVTVGGGWLINVIRESRSRRARQLVQQQHPHQGDRSRLEFWIWIKPPPENRLETKHNTSISWIVAFGLLGFCLWRCLLKTNLQSCETEHENAWNIEFAEREVTSNGTSVSM